MNIVAATDFSTRSNRALRQAGLLTQLGKAKLHIVHVVDDDQPNELIRIEKHEADRVLAEQMDSMPELRGLECHPMVVTGDPFDGVLKAAAEANADLIVMGAHRKHLLLDIFVGTTIERVVRKGRFPVLMVNNEAQRQYQNVVVSIDSSDASANALRAALSTGLITHRGATLLHAFFPLARGQMFVAGLEPSSIEDHVASERKRALDELRTFLVANNLNNQQWSFHVEEGKPIDVISRAVFQMRPDLLVMGTRGRTGVMKALIGSVTEEALRSLSVDILAVPPVMR